MTRRKVLSKFGPDTTRFPDGPPCKAGRCRSCDEFLSRLLKLLARGDQRFAVAADRELFFAGGVVDFFPSVLVVFRDDPQLFELVRNGRSTDQKAGVKLRHLSAPPLAGCEHVSICRKSNPLTCR